eukprot:5606595-Pyramimonas_sp.AAC.1
MAPTSRAPAMTPTPPSAPPPPDALATALSENARPFAQLDGEIANFGRSWHRADTVLEQVMTPSQFVQRQRDGPWIPRRIHPRRAKNPRLDK